VLDRQVLARAYELKLGPEGQLRWLERSADGVQTWHEREPGASWWRRGSVQLMSLLPIDWLL
jgi:putative cardiolipin synthase